MSNKYTTKSQINRQIKVKKISKKMSNKYTTKSQKNIHIKFKKIF